MNRPASVTGHDRLRLFVALRLPDETVRRVASWQASELAASEARVVAEPNLHVTLAFLGSRPAADVDEVLAVVRGAATAAARPVLEPVRYRETRSVGMVVFSDEEERAARLADGVGEGLERIGVYERERREWLPHVTVLRFRRGSGRRFPTSGGSVRPRSLSIIRCCDRPGRSTRSSNRLF